MFWAGWENVTGDSVISTGPCLLAGLVLLASSGGGDVTLYDGVDAIAGRKIGRFEGANNESRPITFWPPLKCEQGLYVDVGSGISELLVSFVPYQGTANPGYRFPGELAQEA